MKTNTELLMNALGWQGGTVHQVAQETRLSVLEILDLDKYLPADGDSHAESFMFAGSVRALEKVLNPIDYKDPHLDGYDLVMYWRGVLATMRDKELDLL